MKEQTRMALPALERIAPWQGQDRWICGAWLVLRIGSDVTVQYHGATVARIICDSVVHSSAVIAALGEVMPGATQEHQLYHALGFTDEHGIGIDFQSPTQRYTRWHKWAKGVKA
jgi:hypothetical protein